MIPEYQGCPLGVVRGSARHASTASSVNQTVKLPRWRKLASYSRQFMTWCFCFGIWWRRSWFSLKGKMGIRVQVREEPPTPSRYWTPIVGSVQQGHGLRSHTDERRAAEVEVAVHVLNHMLELGRPNSVRIA